MLPIQSGAKTPQDRAHVRGFSIHPRRTRAADTPLQVTPMFAGAHVRVIKHALSLVATRAVANVEGAPRRPCSDGALQNRIHAPRGLSPDPLKRSVPSASLAPLHRPLPTAHLRHISAREEEAFAVLVGFWATSARTSLDEQRLRAVGSANLGSQAVPVTRPPPWASKIFRRLRGGVIVGDLTPIARARLPGQRGAITNRCKLKGHSRLPQILFERSLGRS